VLDKVYAKTKSNTKVNIFIKIYPGKKEKG